MEAFTLDDIMQMGQTPVLVLIAYLLWRQSQSIVVLATKVETVLGIVLNRINAEQRKDS